MKSLLLTLSLLLCFPSQASTLDKELHFSVSYGATLTSYQLLRTTGMSKTWALALSGTLVFSAGLAKEQFMDERVDLGDIGANALGTGLGILVPVVFEF